MITVEEINKLCENSMISHLGILVTSIKENEIFASMPVDRRTTQPMGILHGGASIALAETLAGAGSLSLSHTENKKIVGMQVNANHVGSCTSGMVHAHAKIIHKGTKTHIWDVTITDDENQNLSLCRVTNMVLDKTN